MTNFETNQNFETNSWLLCSWSNFIDQVQCTNYTWLTVICILPSLTHVFMFYYEEN